MDIVDAQVHANLLGTDVTIAIMDALGVQAVLFDEFEAAAEDGALHPGYRLSNNAFRCVGPNAEAAALSHPDRFAAMIRMDPTDPGIECWIETLTAAPGFKAIRTVVLTPAEGDLFADRGHDRLLRAAVAHHLPVFVSCPGRVPLLSPYAERFPGVQFVIDHCGAAFDTARGQGNIDDALLLARHPNVAYKWAHAATFLSTESYPFRDLDPKLRQALDAFGPKRVMWASDYTVARQHANWAEALFSIRDSPSLSEDEKAWILGRTARQILNWARPHPTNPSTPALKS